MTVPKQDVAFAGALTIDDAEYLQAARSAVARRSRIEDVADRITARGFKSLYFIGAGGTYANALWFEEFARLNSTLPVRVLVAAELVEGGDPMLDETAVVVISSVTGTTEDVLAAVSFSQERGAHVVSFVPDATSPLATIADSFVETEGGWRGFDIYELLLVTRLLAGRGEFDAYDQLATEMEGLPAAMLDVIKRTEPLAASFAEKHRDSDYFFVIASGNLWGLAYNYSMCVLEEALWVRTTRVTAAEFFHGSLELIEEGTPVLILQGEDHTRPINNRAIAFTRKYSGDVTVVDTKDYPLEGISEQFRPLLSNLVQNHATRRLSLHLQSTRNFDLDSRKYYRKVAY